MGDENGVAFTDDGGNDVRYIGVTRRGRVTTRVPCVGQNVPSCDRHVIYQYISLTHSHSLCFLAGPSVGGIGTTVTSACVNVRSPVRTILRCDLQCRSGHATFASVVIQSCGSVIRYLAANSGSSAYPSDGSVTVSGVAVLHAFGACTPVCALTKGTVEKPYKH